MMLEECRIDVRNQGAEIELEVSAKLFTNPQVYARPALTITPTEFDKLRAGNATLLFVSDVTARISKWLQDPDFDLRTVLGLGADEDRQSRIVFNVSSLRDEKLRYEFAGFPIEMATPKGDSMPLSLHRRVSSIVHYLAKVGSPPTSVAVCWPFKVLIVRAAPTDLPAVPPAKPIAEAIRAFRPELSAAGNLQVDVLSTEADGGFAGSPTKENLRAQLAQGYHILVFLGHGNIQEIPGAAVPVGQLQLENSRRHSDPFEARKVATLLHECPVPVVLLVGCLTGADLSAEQAQLIEAELPRWLRGSQGVAQALINSTSGVQCAVGMRYRIDGDDAKLFLQDFFKSLLAPAGQDKTSSGNVELAVKNGRHALDTSGKQALSWAAPVVFRTLGAEPMFAFLASPPHFEIEKGDREAQLNIWQALAELNWSLRGAGGLYNRLLAWLRTIEDTTFEKVRPHAALIMPERQELDPGRFQAAPAGTRVNVPVRLHKPISVQRLDGRIVETSQQARITKVSLSPAVAALGFELMVGSLDTNAVKFQIEHPAGNIVALPEGELLTLELAVSAATGSLYQLCIEALRSEPQVPLCGATNAVIVPPP
jgi:CHAT domain